MKNKIILFILFLIIFSCDNSGEILFNAVENGKIDTVKELILEGINLNQKDKYGKSPLYYAFENEKWDIFELLIKNGADVNILVSYGIDSKKKEFNDPIAFWAVITKKEEYIKLCIENGYKINTQDNNSYTILSYAIIYCSYEIVKYIIDSGIDINLGFIDKKTKRVKTPLNEALFRGRADVAKLLLDKGAIVRIEGYSTDSIWSELVNISGKELVPIADKIYESGIGWGENFYGLQVAVQEKNYEYAKWLLGHGIDPRIKDKNGDMPMDYIDYGIINPATHEADLEKGKIANKIIELFKSYGVEVEQGQQ